MPQVDDEHRISFTVVDKLIGAVIGSTLVVAVAVASWTLSTVVDTREEFGKAFATMSERHSGLSDRVQKLEDWGPSKGQMFTKTDEEAIRLLIEGSRRELDSLFRASVAEFKTEVSNTAIVLERLRGSIDRMSDTATRLERLYESQEARLRALEIEGASK